jgi:hypothetical protein
MNKRYTRFEVIDSKGRALVFKGEVGSITLSEQDDGKTLKVFLTGDFSKGK